MINTTQLTSTSIAVLTPCVCAVRTLMIPLTDIPTANMLRELRENHD